MMKFKRLVILKEIRKGFLLKGRLRVKIVKDIFLNRREMTMAGWVETSIL